MTDDDITTEVHRVRLFCDNQWAEFDGAEKDKAWSAPLLGFSDKSQSSAYRFLLSVGTDEEALGKLRMIRRAQRMAHEAIALRKDT